MKSIQVLDFETTLKCTHNCVYCYNAYKNHKDYPTAELNTKDTIEMLNKAIEQTRCKRFIFSGGEPFIRGDLRELIEAVHKTKTPISIISNGALIEASDIQHAKENGVDMFEITLLSANREIHNQMVRAKGDFSAFDNALWASQEILKQKLGLVHVFVATRKNIRTLKETLELSYALGCRSFLFNRFNAGGEGSKYIDELQCSPLELSAALKVANNFVVSHPTMKVSCAVNIPPCLVDLKQFPLVKMTGCGIGENQMIYVMDMLGNIRLCNFSSVIVGNIFTQDFWDIIASKKAKDFIKAYPNFCRDCHKLKFCQGGCKASADNCYGDAYEENSFLREFKKETHKP